MNNIIDTYNKVAQEYAQNRTGKEDRAQLKKFQSILKSGSVLDVGCAAGRDTRILHDMGFRVVGIDLAEKLLNIAERQNPDIQFVRADMRSLPFEDNSFDGVWACAVLHHVQRKEMSLVLKELYRVLAPDGTLYISTKAGEGLLETHEDMVAGIGRQFELISTDELDALLRKCGFAKMELLEEPSNSRKNLLWAKGLYKKS